MYNMSNVQSINECIWWLVSELGENTSSHIRIRMRIQIISFLIGMRYDLPSSGEYVHCPFIMKPFILQIIIEIA